MRGMRRPLPLGRIALGYFLILGMLMLFVAATDSSGTSRGLVNFLGTVWVFGFLVLVIAWDRAPEN